MVTQCLVFILTPHDHKITVRTVSCMTFKMKILKEKGRQYLELTCTDQKPEPEFMSPCISYPKLHHPI